MVLAIGLVLTAMAVPVVVTTLDDYQLRGAMTSATNLVQRARTVAIQQDNTQQLYVLTVNGQVVLFGENAANVGVVRPAASDQQYWLTTSFSIPGAPNGAGAPPQLTGLNMWGSNVVPRVNVNPYFNSRGLPCLPNPNVCNQTNGFVYYFRYRSHGVTHWAAVSISPAGRIQSWFWNGATWGN